VFLLTQSRDGETYAFVSSDGGEFRFTREDGRLIVEMLADEFGGNVEWWRDEEEDWQDQYDQADADALAETLAEEGP
jgi:hypothetical protein